MEAHSRDQADESSTTQPDIPHRKNANARTFIDSTLAEPLGDTIDATVIYPCIAYIIEYLMHRTTYAVLCIVIALAVLFNFAILMTTAIVFTIFTFSGVIAALILDG